MFCQVQTERDSAPQKVGATESNKGDVLSLSVTRWKESYQHKRRWDEQDLRPANLVRVSFAPKKPSHPQACQGTTDGGPRLEIAEDEAAAEK
jgi:hypothetical protein